MEKPKTIEELFDRRYRRSYSINIDYETHRLLTQAADVTGKTKPEVLAAFVSTAYELFIDQCRAVGKPVERLVVPLSVVRRRRGRPPRTPVAAVEVTSEPTLPSHADENKDQRKLLEP